MRAGAAAYEYGWGISPIYVRSGATIPVISELVSLSKEAVLLGFSVPTSRTHGPDENIPLSCLERGIAAAVHFVEEYAKRWRS
jgi:acetylornithine deacetylase/succinyl-diaminopimelate desuccinylase-like protein